MSGGLGISLRLALGRSSGGVVAARKLSIGAVQRLT